MLKDEMWKIFEATGKIDAYLYCKTNNENNDEDFEEEKLTLEDDTQENKLS
ncbi:YqzL family protein [Senegalia sp. (in: firmicutes)]|uniref:YqzL family protein n=1 Tax=Senegalia sp. (in: firmicutes) TaxID=1924098 RepID=UPI003F953BED